MNKKKRIVDRFKIQSRDSCGFIPENMYKSHTKGVVSCGNGDERYKIWNQSISSVKPSFIASTVESFYDNALNR